MLKILIACIATGAIAGAAFAKLPPAPPMTDVQKAEKAAKDKATAEKEADLLAKSQDRAATHYKKSQGASAVKVSAPGKAPVKK
jgi:aldehyde:ferredoxin oxidoreductase